MLSWEHTSLPPRYPVKNKNQLWVFNVRSLLYHINSFLQVLHQSMENIWENTHKQWQLPLEKEEEPGGCSGQRETSINKHRQRTSDLNKVRRAGKRALWACRHEPSTQNSWEALHDGMTCNPSTGKAGTNKCWGFNISQPRLPAEF